MQRIISLIKCYYVDDLIGYVVCIEMNCISFAYNKEPRTKSQERKTQNADYSFNNQITNSFTTYTHYLFHSSIYYGIFDKNQVYAVTIYISLPFWAFNYIVATYTFWSNAGSKQKSASAEGNVLQTPDP